MPRCVRVDGEGDGPADVFFRLKGVVNDLWDTGAPPGEVFDRFVKRFPFAIGRAKCEDEAIGLSDADDSWMVCDSQKVSRKHAVILFDERTQLFKIRCYSNNGVDVNRALQALASARLPAHPAPSRGTPDSHPLRTHATPHNAERHISKDEEAPLPSRSTVRIGPLYFFFLLPKEQAAGGGGGGGGGGAEAAAAPAKKPKISAPGGYGGVVEATFKKNFGAFTYFTLTDLARLALLDFPTHNLQEDTAKLHATLTRVIVGHAEFELLPLGAAPPPGELEEFERVYVGSAAQKSVRWVKRLSEAEAAVKRARQVAAKAEKGAGGAGAGGAVIEVID